MDKVIIEGLEVFAKHGVHKAENELGQKFVISAELCKDLHEAGISDDLTKSVHYGEAARYITELVEHNTFKLIERLAEFIADSLLKKFDVKEVKVKVEKPWAPVKLPLETVAVEVVRLRHTAYISFGSNMGDRNAHIQNAIAALNRTDGSCRVVKVSSLIETKPYGPVEQEDFLNGCLQLETTLTPQELLKLLNGIEADEGRERLVHWGPRTLDLDIVFYDDIRLFEDNLIIPHIDMQNRMFVLKPLYEIAPYYMHPVLNKPVIQLLAELPEPI